MEFLCESMWYRKIRVPWDFKTYSPGGKNTHWKKGIEKEKYTRKDQSGKCESTQETTQSQKGEEEGEFHARLLCGIH